MKEIPLTRGHVALVDDEDFEALNQYKWHSSAQGSQKKPYACRKQTINGKRVKIWMHRLIMNCPSDMVVDHIDGNGLNNTRGNLEVVTFHENYIRSQEKRKMTVEDCWL